MTSGCKCADFAPKNHWYIFPLQKSWAAFSNHVKFWHPQHNGNCTKLDSLFSEETSLSVCPHHPFLPKFNLLQLCSYDRSDSAQLTLYSPDMPDFRDYSHVTQSCVFSKLRSQSSFIQKTTVMLPDFWSPFNMTTVGKKKIQGREPHTILTM